MSEKITTDHLTRKAVLYVRQSSPHQVVHNEESRRLQYAMGERLRNLGWTEVEVVDEDQGRSAGGGVERVGFQRMVADVCLGKVGAVAAREVSRFARNSRDWQQLVEVCRLVNTLLIDHETVYDPRRGNDRLLLGLKGSLNEYELDLLRQRSVEARRAKARRGELVVIVPVGYLKTDDQRFEKDPDQRVQQAVQLVFEKFAQLGTVRQTLLWFVAHGLEFPCRRCGASGWETVWRRPTYAMMWRVLHNPIYAGAYCYGKTETSAQVRDGLPRKVIRGKPREQWLALIPERHEGYVEWQQFERIQQMIARNATGSGAAKKGPALLVGLLRCRRCGRKLTVKYTGRAHDIARYACSRGYLDHGEPRCIEFGGRGVEEGVCREVLRVVQPGAIEAAVQAARDEAQQEDEALRALSIELEAARYGVERAFKQYDAVDPDNRLVAEELERRWNAALARVEELEQRLASERAGREQVIRPGRDDLAALASDLERVWQDPETDIRLKKRLVRTLIEEIVADIESEAGEIVLLIHWRGGAHTELCVRRRRRGANSRHTAPETVEVVRTLALVCPDAAIAGLLNRNGLRTGLGNRWTQERVTSLRSKRKIAVYSAERRQAEGWMTLTESAAHLGVTAKTLRLAVERGELAAVHPLPDGPWILRRADLGAAPARTLVDRAHTRRATPAGPASQQSTLFPSTT